MIEDEVVAADVPDESLFADHALHHVVQDAGQQIDHPIAVVVAVAIVEFLEVIQVGVAHGEKLAESMRRRISRSISVVPGSRVEGLTATSRSVRVSEGVEPSRLLRRLEQRRDHLVRPSREPAPHRVRRVPGGHHRERHDRRVGVRFEPRAHCHPLRAGGVGVHHHQRRQRSQHHLLDHGRLGHVDDGEALPVHPVRHEVRYRTTSRRKEENRRARSHLTPRVRVEPA